MFDDDSKSDHYVDFEGLCKKYSEEEEQLENILFPQQYFDYDGEAMNDKITIPSAKAIDLNFATLWCKNDKKWSNIKNFLMHLQPLANRHHKSVLYNNSTVDLGYSFMMQYSDVCLKEAFLDMTDVIKELISTSDKSYLMYFNRQNRVGSKFRPSPYSQIQKQ